MFCLILLVLLLTRRRCWGYCGYYHPYGYYPPYPYAYGAYTPYDPYWRARYYGYGYGYRRWWW